MKAVTISWRRLKRLPTCHRHRLFFVQIWQQYFAAKDTVYAVIPVSSLEGKMKVL